VTSAASAGCHRLIREYDAVCVTNADEMAELFPLDQHPGLPIPDAGPSSNEVRVVDALSARAPRTPADIAARAGLSIGAVRALLGALHLEGRAVERDRGWIRKSS
jgi:DNA processing protein